MSGLGRKVRGLLEDGRPLGGLIQTNFPAINHPGVYSGGLLLDEEGQLIGVNTRVIAALRRGGATGFAIPVGTVARVVRELLAHGHTIRPWLGVRVAPESAFLRPRHGLSSLLERLQNNFPPLAEEQESSGGGLLVVGVEGTSPAAEAGLRPVMRTRAGSTRVGDKILAVDGKEVRTPEELLEIVEEHQVGEQVKLLVLRHGQEEPQELSVELGTRPNGAAARGERMPPEKKDTSGGAARQSNL